MKKTRFKPKDSQSQGFSVFAISTIMVDYKLAFELNNLLGINLIKKADLPVYISGNKAVDFPFYFCKNDDHAEFYLIEDRTSGEPMMRSFLLFASGHFDGIVPEELPDRIGGIAEIFNCNSIDVQNQQPKKGKATKISRLVNNILSDLEYHLLEINREEEDKKIKLKPTQTRSIRKLYN